MNMCSLQQLINGLEYGNRLHISVVFLNQQGNEKTQLSRKSTIHETPFCDAVKTLPHGLARCLRCKRLALEKAQKTGLSFSGHCINGVLEYCRPVVRQNQVIAVIFVGNVADDLPLIHRRCRTAAEALPLNTLEHHADETVCAAMADIVESYVHSLLSRTVIGVQNEPINPAVKLLKDYTDAYYTSDMTLGEIARLGHFNEKYLGRAFKKHTGVSFNEYLNNKRIEHAKTLLRETGRTVADIAVHSGYNSITYFNRVFSSLVGMTPTTYRKNSTEQG